jgi:predicted nuclease with TOPRIM domain
MIIEQLARLKTLELEKSHLLDKLQHCQKENNDLRERLEIALVSLNSICRLQTAIITSEAREIAQATIEVIR